MWFNRLHEQWLRIIQNDKLFTFEELLGKDNFITIRKLNLHFPDMEMFKVIKGNSPPIANELFNRNEGNNYNLRNPSKCLVDWKLYLGLKLWETIQMEIKVFDFLLEFKNKIRLRFQAITPDGFVKNTFIE